MKKTTLLLLMVVAFTWQMTAQVNVSSSPGVAIPDATTSHTAPGVITDDIVVGTTVGTIVSMTVDLNITHTWVGDVRATLESPAGTTVRIVSRPGSPGDDTFGCSGDDINANFDDTATLTAEDNCGTGAPPTGGLNSGPYSPNEALAAFAGESATGTWTLTVEDYGQGDLGTWNSWGLNITGPTLSTGSNEIAGFNYSPNPVKKNLSINAASAIENISVYNMLGQQVLRVAPNATSNNLDMSELNAGAYFVKVSVGDVTQTVRIIKQ